MMTPINVDVPECSWEGSQKKDRGKLADGSTATSFQQSAPVCTPTVASAAVLMIGKGNDQRFEGEVSGVSMESHK